MPWNPETYNKFQAQRSVPFDDLVKLIKKRKGMKVLDLGCGTGDLTLRLADALPGGEILGIDNSKEMLTKAQSLTRDGVSFELQDTETVSGKWDLIFSHAALQWVDDHGSFIPQLF